MVFWQSNIHLVLLLIFSGLNLIRSDCGADVDQSNGICDNRYIRRIDHNYDKEQSRRTLDQERKGNKQKYLL